MQSALVSTPLASTPPQHTPTRRKSGPGGVFSFRSTTEGSQEATSSFSQRGSASFFDQTGSWKSLGRSEVQHQNSIKKAASFVKVEGFDAPPAGTFPTSPVTSPPASPGMNRASSLLSRQLSAENLATLNRPTPASATSTSPSSFVKRIEKHVEAAKEASPNNRMGTSSVADNLLQQLQAQYEVFREPLVIRAFNVSRAAHDGRIDGPNNEPAFIKCSGAAAILAELGADEVAVAGALLHDALDVTMLTEAQLRMMLGNDEAMDLVKQISHLGYVVHRYRSASNSVAIQSGTEAPSGVASHLVGLLVAHGPPRALLVRLAVSLQEARALDARPPTVSSIYMSQSAIKSRAADRRRAAGEAIELWAPLANRLGVWSLKAELEDRAFRALHPAQYAELRDRLEQVQQPTRLVAVLDTLRHQLQKAGVEYLDLSGRPKHLWGVWAKMQKKGYSAEKVTDVRGLRVIVKNREDCYRALRAVENAWKLMGIPKNYIKAPKSNGYQSLHAVADPGDGHLVEIQIRTDKMHYLAEYGADAAHWRYKEGKTRGTHTTETNSSSSSEGSSPGVMSGGIPVTAERSNSVLEANWAKYVTSQQVMTKDKKFRPSGSPGGDQSLQEILASIEDVTTMTGSNATALSSPNPTSTTPNPTTAVTGRTFQEYIAFTKQRPTPPEESRALVAVVAGNAFSVAELAAGTTVRQLLNSCGEGLVGGTDNNLHVVVNRQVESEWNSVLKAGDVVELYLLPSSVKEERKAVVMNGKPPLPGKGNMMPLGALSRKFSNATTLGV